MKDEQALWDVAKATMPGVLVQETIDWLGNREDPDVMSCLWQIFDPDKEAFDCLSYINRGGGRLWDEAAFAKSGSNLVDPQERARNYIQHLATLSVAEANWWFIENVHQDDPARAEVFFYLRERN